MIQNSNGKSLHERPILFFSQTPSFYHSAQRLTLTNPSPYYFEDATLFFYVSEGRGFTCVNGLNFQLQRGCLCQFNSFHVFEFIPNEDTPLELVVLLMDSTIGNYLTVDSNSQSEITYNMCPVYQLSENDYLKAEELISRIEQENHRDDPFSFPIKTSLLGQLSTLFTDAHLSKRDHFYPPLGWRILTYITEFDSQKLSCASVAQHFGITPSALNRELRKITTYNFNQILTRARINSICALLPLKGFSLKFLANYIGFSSEMSFYRAFHEWRGMTPQEYRDVFTKQIRGYQTNNIADIPWVILNYICKNYLLPISLKTAAQELYLNESQINQELLQFTGASFQTYLIRHRLRYAEALLKTSCIPICDVAIEAGFNSVNTFYRVFKEQYGMSASVYRSRYGRCEHG